MTGLEKIINKISSDSSKRCEAIVANAHKQAESIAARAEQDNTAAADAIIAEAEEKCARIAETAQARAVQTAKQELLKAKITAINDTIDAAAARLAALAVDDYCAALIKLVSRHAQPGSCEMLLCAADRERMPADFSGKAIAAAAQNGAKLSLTDEDAPIANGFILRYGDIEINCSFAALIDEHREELKEKVNAILF